MTLSKTQMTALRIIGEAAIPGVVHGVARPTLNALNRRGLVAYSRDAGGPVITEDGRRILGSADAR